MKISMSTTKMMKQEKHTKNKLKTIKKKLK